MPRNPYFTDRDYSDKTYAAAPDCLGHIGESKTGGINFEKGQMTGRFEMGSTIVLIWESPEDKTIVYVEPG